MVNDSQSNTVSYWLAIAGVLSFAFTLAHIIGGGGEVYSPILESELFDVLKGYVSVIWHGITATMLLCSVLLMIAAWRPSLRVSMTLTVVIHYALFVALFLFYGAVRFQSVFVMPQWIGFAIISSVALAGLWKSNHTTMETASS